MAAAAPTPPRDRLIAEGGHVRASCSLARCRLVGSAALKLSRERCLRMRP